MPEYTYKDIIIDPTSDEAKNCIGKMAYHADSPSQCLSFANGGGSNHCGILKETKPYMNRPFMFNTEWGCIIPKKEEPKPEYVPFESVDEFLDAYEDAKYSITNGTIENRLLNHGGIWLKRKNGAYFNYYNVTELYKESGLVIGGSTLFWDILLMNYKFLDGTPCGKIKE